MPDRCYPCSVYKHPCVQGEQYVPPARPVPVVAVSVRPGCFWFDVALWRNVGRDLFPVYEGYMEVHDAFSAIKEMMRYYQLWSVSYASARRLDGSLVYRAYQVWIDLREGGLSDE
jgi:hypothetical protein